jgi:hypothetical protein
MLKGSPHCGQVVMPMAKTHLSNWAQLIRARGEAKKGGGIVVPIGDVRLRVRLTGHDLRPQCGIGRKHARVCDPASAVNNDKHTKEGQYVFFS